MAIYTEPDQCTIRYDSAASGNTRTLDPQVYYLQCVAACVAYHHLLDSGYRQLLVSTYGCVLLTDAKGKKLVTGSGPVDGPATQASSTRSELHGFAAPLEYIHQLACYYSMRPKGQYEWECDSQCALNQIDVLLKFEQRRRQPYNAHIISNLTQRLGQNRPMTIKSTWVKAHQDEKKIPGHVLSDAALRNIKADSIAKNYLLDPC